MCLKNNLDSEPKNDFINQVFDFVKILMNIMKDETKDKLYRYELLKICKKNNLLKDEERKIIELSKEDYDYITANYEELIKQNPDAKEAAAKMKAVLVGGKIKNIILNQGCQNCKLKVCSKLDVSEKDLCEECKQIIKLHINSQ